MAATLKVRKSAVVGETGFKRIANDAYFTEPCVTEALLNTICLPQNVWEPACGDGSGIVAPLRSFGHSVFASDLHEYPWRGPAEVRPDVGRDFLKSDLPFESIEAIVTNPPFGDMSEAFIWHAIELMTPVRGKIAILQRTDYDAAKSRRGLFATHPAFSHKLVLHRRPRWIHDKPKSEQKAPRFQYAWFLWDLAKDASQPPVILYT